MKTGNESSLSSYKSGFTAVFALAYSFGLFYLVFEARRRRSLHKKFNLKMVNLRPIWGKIIDLSKFVRLNQQDQITNFFTDVSGNIILFIPLPFCIFLIFGSIKLKSALLFGATTSLLIEVIQFVFGLGVADIDDVLLNTLGTFLGYKLIRFATDTNPARFTKYISRK